MEEGNIDRERIVNGDLIPDEYFCPICQCLLWKPRSCASCQHLFCQKCIQIWSQNTTSANKCPFRCQPFEERRSPPYVHSLLARLNIHCRNADSGCSQVLSYNSLEQHEDIECEYLTQRCSECEQLVLVSKMDEHREVQGLCIPRPVKCIICQEYFEKSHFIDHFRDCWETRFDELLEQTSRLHNASTLHPTNTQKLVLNWFNIRNLFEQSRQMSRQRSNLNGGDEIKQARERGCGVFYHICMMLTFIFANWSKAPFLVLSFSFIGFVIPAILIFGLYTIVIKWMSTHPYYSYCLTMLFSYMSSYTIPRFLQSTSDSSIIYFFGLFIFLCGCSIRVPLELFEMNPLINMTKVNIVL